jgi:uncharacterized protein (DUF362 family)
LDQNSKVALIKGDSRYDNTRRALSLIADSIDLANRQRVVIKPNFVSASRQLAATHIDAIRATLDFVRERHKGKVYIAEAAELGTTQQGYRNFGYLDLPKEYDVELVDLYNDDSIACTGFDRQLKPNPLRVSRFLAESDFRISVGPPKTHESTVITLSAKNMVVGSLSKGDHGNDRKKFHQGYQAMNLNMYKIVQLVFPHLVVIDGFEGMEGNGPCSGEPVDLRVAIASSSFVAADAVGAAVMGQDLEKLGWLQYCQRGGLGVADLARITILGNSIAECRKPFRRHPDYDREIQWEIKGVERYL